MATLEPLESDRCPHERPFPADFCGCPAFQPTAFAATDSMHRTLGTKVTCRHLTVGEDAAGHGRYYARCGLGDRAARLRWLAEVGTGRFEVVRALQEAFEIFTWPQRAELHEARARARRAPGEASKANLDRALEVFLEATAAFLRDNEGRIREVGIPPEALPGLVEEWSRAWARSREFDDPRASEESLARVPAGARAFLGPAARPRRPATGGVQAGEGGGFSGVPVFDDGVLRISVTSEPDGLAFAGEIDATNMEAVAQALAGVRPGGDLHVDLSRLLFCDVAGLGALVRAAEGLDGGRLVVHGMPQEVARAMELAGWSGAGDLVFSPAAGPVALPPTTAAGA